MPTTISCQDDTKDRFDDLRPAGVRSNDEFLRMLLDTFDEDAEPDAPVSLVDAVSGDAGEIAETLERIESSVSTAEERAGRIERTLEEMGR